MVQPASVQIHQRAGYILLETLDYPGYWDGNCLFLLAPPSPDSLQHWFCVWEREFVNRPSVNTGVLQWEVDSSASTWGGAKQPLTVEGWPKPLEVTSASARVLRTPQPPAYEAPVDVRPVETDEEWKQVRALVLTETDPADEKRRRFHRWRLDEYQHQIKAGDGCWWGGFSGAELWGAAGFFRRNGLARFQEVITARPMRGRGVCSHLVYAIATDHLDRYPNGTVVIASKHSSLADSIYARLGFREVSRQWSVIAKRA